MSYPLLVIQGGTFNPIHYGHLRCVTEVCQALNATALIIPNALPPHRQSPKVTAEHRLTMSQLACSDNPQLQVCDIELRRSEPSYSVETLRQLRRQYPQHALCFMLGTDAFSALDSWYQWNELFELCHLVLCTRPGYQLTLSAPLQAQLVQRQVSDSQLLQQQANGLILTLPVTALDISATQIRQLFAKQHSAKYLLPDNVINYIDQHGFYRDLD